MPAGMNEEDGAMPTPEEEAAAKAAEEAAATAAKEKADADAAAAKKAEEEKAAAALGDAGKAALDAERKRAKDAEKALKDAQAKLDAIEQEKLSETEKAAKRATEAEANLAAAQEKLRRANLIAELSKPDHKIVNAQAAAKLIDGVEFGDDGEPTNLDAVLPKFLEANAFLVGGPPPPPKGVTDSGAGNGDGKAPELTAEQLAAAKQSGMTPEEYAAYLPKDGEPVTLAHLDAAGLTKQEN